MEIHNYTGEPIQLILLNGKILDIPAEEPPFKVKSKQPFREAITIDVGVEKLELIVEGNAVAIEGEAGFPAMRPGIAYIVTDEMANVLRKALRGTTADLFIPVKTANGYFKLRRANDITKFEEDWQTQNFTTKVLENNMLLHLYDEQRKMPIVHSNR